MRRLLTLFILALVLITYTTTAASTGQQSDPVVPDAADAADTAESPDAPDATTYVYWTEVLKGTILRGNANGSGSPQTCVTGQQDPRGLVVVAERDTMYWLDRSDGKLRRANLNCPAGSIFTYGYSLSVPDRLFVDVAGGMLYWSENQNDAVKSNRIRRANIDNSGSPETVVSGLGAPVGLVVASIGGQRYLYWTEFESDSIWRINLSGGSKEKLVTLAKGTNPLDIALDVPNNRMYWLSGALGGIYSATLTGGNASLWLGADAPRSMVLDLGSRHLYWGDQGSKEIRRVNLDGSGNTVLFNSADGVDRPLGVALVLSSTSPPCYTLSRSRTPTAGGNVPTANPGSSDGCASGKYTAGTSITLSATAAAGWHIAGWTGTNNDAGTANTNTVDMPAADHAVSVIYEQDIINCYTLNRSRTPTNGGNVPTANPGSSGGCGSGSYTAGTTITLEATANSGWHVAGWTGTNNDAGTATVNTVTMPAANHSVSVIYEQDANPCYTLNRSRTPTAGGNVPVAAPAFSSGCGTGQYTAGELITLTATAATGWHVAGWTGTNNDAGTATVNTVTMPAANHSVSVIYEQDVIDCYALGRTRSGEGSVPTPSPSFSSGCGTGHYKAGESITLTAAPATGWRVAGWTGTNNDSSTATVNTVTMPSGPHAVSVIYEAVCYSLSLSHTGSGSNPAPSPGSSTGCGAGQYTAGQSITLTATPTAGWRVAGWSGTNNDGGTSTINSVIMPAANHAAAVTYVVIPVGSEYRALLPGVLNIPQAAPSCFMGQGEEEPNNTAATANGPLCAPGGYTGLPNDQMDYFTFTTGNTGRIVIGVSNHRGEGVQLLLYANSVTGDPVAEDNDQSNGLRVEVPNAAAGRYYVIIYTETPKPNETQRYTMSITYP